MHHKLAFGNQITSPYTDYAKAAPKGRNLYGTRRIYQTPGEHNWISSTSNTRKTLLTAGSVRHNSNRTVCYLYSSTCVTKEVYHICL